MKRYLILAALLFGGGYLFFATDGVKSATAYVQNSDLLTLETKYSAEDLMEKHKKDLIGNSAKTYQEPSLNFHPYLLMDVKYYDKGHKTKQGKILWSLMDGEMVINTDSWQKTNGFEDAINAGATLQEFRLLNALADNRSSLSREKLQKELNIEQETLSSLIDSAKQKKLIVTKGNDVILHFEDPLFNVTPETKLATELVIKPNRQGKKLSAKYSRAKVERIAKAAFGSDFTIREMKEIYLPVIQISVLNPDGSVLVTDWNALTGDKMRRT